jgi:cyanate permease
MINIIAWIDIALGLLIGVVNLIKLTVDQAESEMARRRARRNAWLNLLASLLIIAVGMTGFGFSAKSDATEWVLRLATFAIVSFMLILWLRPRVRGKPTGETTELHGTHSAA